MANTSYISAGLQVKKTTGAATANTAYISAGLQPAVEEETPASGQPIIKRLGGVPFCKINQGVW